MDFAAALIDENDAFADVLRDADPATPVPTCPGWTLRQLLRHVGRGHRWSAQIVDERRADYLDPREVRGGKPPDGGEIDWLRESAHAVVGAVDRVGGETEVWTFLGPRPARWWIRRRLHEATVHRADAALALGRDYRLRPDLAADGLFEWLERVVIEAGDDHMPLAHGQTLHLHATDGGEWTLRGRGSSLELGRTHANATATVSADATSLFLAVVRRIPADDPRITVTGDADIWRTWLQHTPF